VPTITPTKYGFRISHTTREVWGVDDPDESITVTSRTTKQMQETDHLHLAKLRTKDRHAARRLKQSAASL
jgi:hypothetical protein